MEIGQSLTLEIKGLGHVPSFKNCKRIAGKRLVTEPKIKARMEQIIRAIELRLSFVFRTIEQETEMELCPLCWIAQSMPLDDSWRIIPTISVNCVKVAKGEEGAVIVIERIA